MTQSRMGRSRAPEIAAAALALFLWGCPGSCATPAPKDAAPPVVLDGRLDPAEWGGKRLRADGRDIFVRLSLPKALTLQAADESVVVLLDVDGDPTTGSGLEYVQGETEYGAEIAIVFSPPGERPRLGGRSGEGVAVLLLPDGDGVPRRTAHDDFDFVFAPTVASRDFELRLSRGPVDRPEIAEALVSGTIAAHVLLVAKDTSLAWEESLGSLELPPLSAAEPSSPRTAASVPARRDDALRVVSWNVLFASPAKKPEPFARVLRALDPDVVLVQEWERASAADLESWFETNVGAEWNALDSEGWGVAVVARGALTRLGPARLARPREAPADAFRSDEAMRVAAAVVDTRLGRVAVGSIHLKCCGGDGSPEDRARVAEARLLRDTLASALAELGAEAPTLRILGGDLNLVGSDRPLEALASRLGADGGDLEIAEGRVLGDRAVYTWRGRRSRFTPGRLDYLLYGGGEVVEAFALDTARLSDAALIDAKIERDDSAASDHLALVLDVRPSSNRSVTEAP